MTATCGVVTKLHVLCDPHQSRFTVRKAAFSSVVEESMHHILLPFSGMTWKDFCRNMRLLQNIIQNQSSCDRLLQFCLGPWRECPEVTSRTPWALYWLLMAAICTDTHDGCWFVGHLPLKAASSCGTTFLQMELWTVFTKAWHLTSGARVIEISQNFFCFVLVFFHLQIEVQDILSCWDVQTRQLQTKYFELKGKPVC